jgi:hypothetical protein
MRGTRIRYEVELICSNESHLDLFQYQRLASWLNCCCDRMQWSKALQRRHFAYMLQCNNSYIIPAYISILLHHALDRNCLVSAKMFDWTLGRWV